MERTPWKTNYRNILGKIKPYVIRIITDEGIEGNFWDLQNLVQNTP